jgi:hypothetical protein
MRKRFEVRMAYTRQSHPRTVIGREPSCVVSAAQSWLADRKRHGSK